MHDVTLASNFQTTGIVTHSHSHWSTEMTMHDYGKEIIIPYVASQRDMLNKHCPALVIMDNFKGQVTSSILDLLEQHEIHVSFTLQHHGSTPTHGHLGQQASKRIFAEEIPRVVCRPGYPTARRKEC